MAEKLEEKLEKVKDENEKKDIEKKLEILDTIEENEINGGAGEFPEYADTACYGGGLEHGD
jgi:hypothetical protein